MQLFENEKTITSTDDDIIVLTTHRIRSNNSIRWGQHNTTSIMLEKVSSIQATYDSYPTLLILAGVLALGTVLVSSQGGINGAPVLALILAAVFVIAYFLTRKHVCIIASDGGARIAFATANMDMDSLLKFIDQVEQAKYNRSMQYSLS